MQNKIFIFLVLLTFGLVGCKQEKKEDISVPTGTQQKQAVGNVNSNNSASTIANNQVSVPVQGSSDSTEQQVISPQPSQETATVPASTASVGDLQDQPQTTSVSDQQQNTTVVSETHAPVVTKPVIPADNSAIVTSDSVPTDTPVSSAVDVTAPSMQHNAASLDIGTQTQTESTGQVVGHEQLATPTVDATTDDGVNNVSTGSVSQADNAVIPVDDNK